MKFYIVLLLLAVHQSSFAQFNNGNDLIKFVYANDRVLEKRSTEEDRIDASIYLGYLEGVVDSNRTFLTCRPSILTGKQLMGVVTKYLKDNPDRWNLSGDRLVVLAMSEAFPCSKVIPFHGELDKPKKN